MIAMLLRATIALTVLLALTGCRLREDNTEGGAIPPPDDVAAVPADALTTPSGLASKMLRVGFSNVRPGPGSTVTVHYTGWTPDGEMFDSSVANGSPITTRLDRLIPGWVEGVQLMVVGEKRRFWIPGSLAYDDIDVPGAPKGMLVFDIELLEVR